MVVRLIGALVVGVLVAGGVRVVTYDPPEPEVAAINLWGALLTARAGRATVEVVGLRGTPAERAEGTLEFAAERAALTVTEGGPYEEVTAGAVAYVRAPGGRWYTYTGAAGPGSRAFRLLTLLSSADPLEYDGTHDVRGVRTDRFVSGARDVGRFEVYVDADGFPRRLELFVGNIVRVDLYDFLLPDPVVLPRDARPARDAVDALRKAGVS